MKIQRKILVLALALLLISAGIVAAQSSSNFIMQRFVMVGGSSADSSNYSVTSVFGQPATGVFNSGSYEVTAGFLHPQQGYKVWVPVVLK
jgi:hypothetical protein